MRHIVFCDLIISQKSPISFLANAFSRRLCMEDGGVSMEVIARCNCKHRYMAKEITKRGATYMRRNLGRRKELCVKFLLSILLEYIGRRIACR